MTHQLGALAPPDINKWLNRCWREGFCATAVELVRSALQSPLPPEDFVRSLLAPPTLLSTGDPYGDLCDRVLGIHVTQQPVCSQCAMANIHAQTVRKTLQQIGPLALDAYNAGAPFDAYEAFDLLFPANMTGVALALPAPMRGVWASWYVAYRSTVDSTDDYPYLDNPPARTCN